mmetsp:Transcript_454/g.520  ORF Transcript_454/g.520 Transcript_454/m.520 type:complete len:326 (+) Transcript_454:212-1189(+)
MSEAKLQRTILRFKSKIESGAYYEAHQTLRTITNRYVKSNQYSDAIDLLYQGSSILSSNKEYASASDLISYLINVYEESGIKCTNEGSNKDYKLKLIELISLLPDTDPSLPDLAKQSIGWSQTDKLKFGDCDLHHTLGAKFLNSVKDESNNLTEDDRQKLFAYAESHLILGTHESLPVYIDFLYQWFEDSKDNVDPGVFMSRAVINYSYLKNVKFVQESIKKFMSKLIAEHEDYEVIEESESKIYYYQDPNFQFVNFLQLLSITLVKENAGQKFMKLYHEYKNVLVKYESLGPVEYLGKLYFGLNLGNPQGGQNMLANLMGGLFK